MTDDERHLDLLGIFHYVVGGMTALFSLFPLLHVAVGTAMLRGGFGGKDAPPVWLGWIFVVLGGVLIVAGETLAAAMLVAGRKLRARKARTFCVVIACIECLMMPFGTVLGVFTLVILLKEPVIALFAAGAPPRSSGIPPVIAS